MKQEIFTPLEIDTLQETLNIAFGAASAELAEVIDIFIALDTPRLNVSTVGQLESYILDQINLPANYAIVEQHFSGGVTGVTLLIFPEGAGLELLSYFNKSESGIPLTIPLENIDKEALMEIGNILIGACMSKLYELLDINIKFYPPRITVTRDFKQFFDEEFFEETHYAITLKTNFKFEDNDVTGHLFIITNDESSSSFKEGLNKFWESINER